MFALRQSCQPSNRSYNAWVATKIRTPALRSMASMCSLMLNYDRGCSKLTSARHSAARARLINRSRPACYQIHFTLWASAWLIVSNKSLRRQSRPSNGYLASTLRRKRNQRNKPRMSLLNLTVLRASSKVVMAKPACRRYSRTRSRLGLGPCARDSPSVTIMGRHKTEKWAPSTPSFLTTRTSRMTLITQVSILERTRFIVQIKFSHRTKEWKMAAYKWSNGKARYDVWWAFLCVLRLSEFFLPAYAWVVLGIKDWQPEPQTSSACQNLATEAVAQGPRRAIIIQGRSDQF